LSPLPHEDAHTAARLALQCLDLTSLRDDDTDASIRTLAARAATPHGAPAALCVFPRFVATAKQALAAQGLSAACVATVVNFPHGGDTAAAVAAAIDPALANGADEIDAVLPWRALMAGDETRVQSLLRACRAASGGAPLKVILETGELQQAGLVRRAAELAIEAGADFVKTSTGKVPVNATPEAVAVMLEVIAGHHAAGGAKVGLKVAGGMASVADVQRYLALLDAACGPAWATPALLRFGASSLLPVLLAALDGEPAPPSTAAAAPGY